MHWLDFSLLFISQLATQNFASSRVSFYKPSHEREWKKNFTVVCFSMGSSGKCLHGTSTGNGKIVLKFKFHHRRRFPMKNSSFHHFPLLRNEFLLFWRIRKKNEKRVSMAGKMHDFPRIHKASKFPLHKINFFPLIIFSFNVKITITETVHKNPSWLEIESKKVSSSSSILHKRL